MKTTLDLPDSLMRRVKVRAASEGRKLKDLASELLKAGLEAPAPAARATDAQPVWHHDPRTGFPVIRSLAPPGTPKVSLQSSLKAMAEADESEDLRRAGLPG